VKERIQRLLRRVSQVIRRIFSPVLLATDDGAVVLVETPQQIITRKAVALALGSLAIAFLTLPSSFAFDEVLAFKIGDWLARTASILWNFNGTVT
jgi:hypothetical protein